MTSVCRWLATASLLLMAASAIARVAMVDGALTAGIGRLQREVRCPTTPPAPAVLGHTDRVQTWTRVSSTTGGAVIHLYYRRDDQRLGPVALQWRLVSHNVLDVPAGVTDWPIWSTRAVHPGEWRVDMRDLESTDLLCTMRFVLTSPTPARDPGQSSSRVRQHARRT